MKMENNYFLELEKKIGYYFKNKKYLEMALSHPSLKQNIDYKFDYQRLEFFGDSILSLIITKELYNLYKNFDEGKLTQFRNYLVSKEIICKAAYKIDLDIHIIMTKGEEKSGGRTNINNIENTLEALIAGIYIDSDYIIENSTKFVLALWSEFFTSYEESYDAKTYIQNYSQSLGFGAPKYEVIKEEGRPHSPEFTVSVKLENNLKAEASGQSIKEAQKKAARKLQLLLE